mgnify:CR=1 FL=1
MSHFFSTNPVSQIYPQFCGEKGQLGFVVSTPGIGKSTLCTLIGLESLLSAYMVLHISINNPQQAVRVRYEQSLGHILEAESVTESVEVRKALESQRLIHAVIGRSCSMPYVQEKILLFKELLEFVPDIVIIDGLDQDWNDEQIKRWKQIATEHDCMVWISTASSVPKTVSHVLKLTEDNQNVLLQHHETRIPLAPTTLLCKTGPHLSTDEVTLFSGGTMGAEAFFGQTAERFGVRDINFTFEGHEQKRSVNASLLSAKELNVGATSLSYVSRVLNRTWTRTENLQKVVQVLWHIVSHADQVFVVGTIQPDNTVHGGTGWSVELAKRWHKPVWVFDQTKEDWFHWTGTNWISDKPRITARNIAGSGTRFLNHAGKQAIVNLFRDSFNQSI